jgi:hypothetical protein
MPVVDHTAPTGTYGRAAANLAVKASPTALSALYLRAALGAVAALGGCAAAAAAAALIFFAAPRVLLPCYLAAELAFAVLWYRRLARLSAIPDVHQPEGIHQGDGERAFERFLRAAATLARLSGDGADDSAPHLCRGSFVEALIARWCRAGQPYGERGAAAYGATGTRAAALERTASALLSGVTRGNAAEMLAYGFFYSNPLDSSAPDAAAMRRKGEHMAKRLEQAWGRSFAPGPANRDLRLMQHLNEPVRAHWRPLAFYLGTEAIAWAKHWALLASGWRFQPAAADGSRPCYYTFGVDAAAASSNSKDSSNNNKGVVPILFCHGVGLGLAPYVPLIQRLAATGRPVIAVEYPHLAMRWTDAIPTIDEAAHGLERVLQEVGAAPRCDAMAHSFSTMYVARLLRTKPELVRTVCLLDPVTTAMWSGDLVSSFVYQPFASSKALGFITGLIARDLQSAVAVSRRFYWTDCNLFAEDLEAWGENKALLVVGGRDDLVPAAHVATTVAAGGAATMLHASQRSHADVVFHMGWQQRAVDEAFAQIAAADWEDMVCEAAEVVAAVATATATAAPTTSKAAWARVGLVTAASVSAVCADGEDGEELLRPALLPIQKSYSIAAGVVGGGGGGGVHQRRRGSDLSSAAPLPWLLPRVLEGEEELAVRTAIACSA